MIAQKCLPVGRGGATRARDHVFGDGSLGDLEAELEQFAVDPGSAPPGIGVAHLPDELDGAWADRLATRLARSAFQAPEEPEPGTVPLEDRAQLNQAEPGLPIGARLREPRPEGAVQRGQARAFVGAAEDQGLLAQSEVLQEQIPAGV